MHQIKAGWYLFHIVYVAQLFFYDMTHFVKATHMLALQLFVVRYICLRRSVTSIFDLANCVLEHYEVCRHYTTSCALFRPKQFFSAIRYEGTDQSKHDATAKLYRLLETNRDTLKLHC